MSASGPISHQSAVRHLRALACTYLHLLEVGCRKCEPGLVGFPEHGRAVRTGGEPRRRCFARWSFVLDASPQLARPSKRRARPTRDTRLTRFLRPAGAMPEPSAEAGMKPARRSQPSSENQEGAQRAHSGSTRFHVHTSSPLLGTRSSPRSELYNGHCVLLRTVRPLPRPVLRQDRGLICSTFHVHERGDLVPFRAARCDFPQDTRIPM